MKRFRFGALVALAVLAAPADAQENGGAASDSAAAAAQFAQIYTTFAEAYRQADPAMVSALYADDAFYLAPGEPIERGRAAVDSAFAFLKEGGRPGPAISFDIVDRGVRGDLAYDIGYFRLGSRQPNGKFIVIWKRGDDGRWRFWADGYSNVDPEERDSGDAPPAARDTAPVSLVAADVAKLTGRFRGIVPEVPEPPVIEVSVENGRLRMAGLTPQPVRLEPISATLFRVVGDRVPPGATLRFAVDGEVVSGVVAEAEGMPGPMVFVPVR